MKTNFNVSLHKMRWWVLRLLSSLMIMTLLVLISPRTVSALNTCYAVADNEDVLVSLNKTTGETAFIGNNGTDNIEAIAFQPSTDNLYAADGHQLGRIGIVTGAFTVIGPFGAGSGSAGTVVFDDVDGISWDNATDVLVGVQRRGAQGEPDALFQIEPTTGAVKPGVFSGADYVLVGLTQAGEADIDDIAFHPVTGVLYGLANSGGTGGTLVIIDTQTGAITEVGPLLAEANPSGAVDDMEGLSFFNDGQLYGSTGDFGPDVQDRNRLYSIDLTTATATLIAAFPDGYGDFEALACLTADIADDDQDGIVNAGEDINSDGNLQNDDTDSDGIPNYLDPDDDGDTIVTRDEDANGNGNPLDDDTDQDAIPNYLDADDDNDGVLTRDEATGDDDQDGVPNYLEGGDTDEDSIPNQSDNDDDGDGILTMEEDLNGNSNRFDDDTDSDGAPNFLDTDDDGDGIPTATENGNPENADADNDLTANYLDADSDGDGYSDAAEWSTAPDDPLQGCLIVDPICFNNDVDGDDTFNFLDLDSDGDGAPDEEETLIDSNINGIPNWLDALVEDLVIYFLPLIRHN